jgi:putative transposase
MKYPFIARHRAVWSVSELCWALGVSRSGFYEWHGRSPSARERANTRLTGRIRESFEASPYLRESAGMARSTSLG